MDHIMKSRWILNSLFYSLAIDASRSRMHAAVDFLSTYRRTFRLCLQMAPFPELTHIAACSRKKNKIAELKKNAGVQTNLEAIARVSLDFFCSWYIMRVHTHSKQWVRVRARACVCLRCFSICELLAQRIAHMLKSIALRLNIHIIMYVFVCMKCSKHTARKKAWKWIINVCLLLLLLFTLEKVKNYLTSQLSLHIQDGIYMVFCFSFFFRLVPFPSNHFKFLIHINSDLFTGK